MRSKPETFAAYADECDRKALGVTDGRLKGLFFGTWRSSGALWHTQHAHLQPTKENVTIFIRSACTSQSQSAAIAILHKPSHTLRTFSRRIPAFDVCF